MSTTTPRGEMFAGYTNLVVESCFSCGVLFAMPEELRNALLRRPGPTGRQFYCPNGHSQHYLAESPEKELEREREKTARVQARLDQAQASERAQRAAATRARNERDRLKTRTANGVCPCCNRTFKQLSRHMAAKHPDFEETP